MIRTRRPLRPLLREALLTGAAVTGVVCLLAALGSFAFDIRPLVFRSGSMGPDIPTGSLALARTVPATTLRPGDVVSVTNARGTRITHRITTVTPVGTTAVLTLKGDANPVVDPEAYTVSQADRLFWHVPTVGYLLSWLSSRYAAFAGGAVLGVLLARAFAHPAPDPPPPPASSAGSVPGVEVGPYRGTSVGVLLVAVLTGVVCGPAPVGTVAAFVNSGTATTGTFSTIPYFTCDAAIMADVPRIYYKLNETSLVSTTAADSSGNARSGVYQGTVTKGVTSPCTRDGGTAVTLNGSSGYVNHGTAITIPTTYSATTWFRTTTTRGGLILGWGSAATGASNNVDRVLYMTNTGGLVFGNNNAAKNTVSSPGSYNDGQWHHVLATVGTAGMRLYVDGNQVAASTTTATASYSGFFRLGYDRLNGWPSVPTSNYFAGSVDEAAIYTQTLAAADAQEHYRAGP